RCHEQDCGLNMGQLRMQISGESGSVFSAIQQRQTLPMSVDELADKLIALGAGFTKKTLVAHIEEGNLFLPDFLKCLIILRSHSLDSFLDYKDIVAAAEAEVASQA
ncbi:hypothetical protein, partial [Herbaspirillum aquaticum]